MCDGSSVCFFKFRITENDIRLNLNIITIIIVTTVLYPRTMFPGQ